MDAETVEDRLRATVKRCGSPLRVFSYPCRPRLISPVSEALQENTGVSEPIAVVAEMYDKDNTVTADGPAVGAVLALDSAEQNPGLAELFGLEAPAQRDGSPIRSKRRKQQASTQIRAVRRNPSRYSKQETEMLAHKMLLHQFKEKADESHLQVFKDKSNPGKGRCLKTLVTLAEGDFVAEYQGSIISRIEALKQEKILEEKKDMRCYFLFFYDTKLQCTRVVDSTKSRGKARFVNHSKTKANVKAKVIDFHGQTKVVFVAINDITADTELLLDYGDTRRSAIESNSFLKH